MEYTIYKLTNKLNGMGYIGMTKYFKRRIGEHHWGGKKQNKRYIDQVIHDYGWENFTVEVIEICDAEVAPERERHWIKEFNTKVPHGYNRTTGGEMCSELSIKTRVQLSANRIKKTVFPVLQAELDKQNLTRIAFAQKLGFGEGAVSAWMTGRCEPKLSTAIRVKEVLGVDMPLEELFAKATAQQSE